MGIINIHPVFYKPNPTADITGTIDDATIEDTKISRKLFEIGTLEMKIWDTPTVKISWSDGTTTDISEGQGIKVFMDWDTDSPTTVVFTGEIVQVERTWEERTRIKIVKAESWEKLLRENTVPEDEAKRKFEDTDLANIVDTITEEIQRDPTATVYFMDRLLAPYSPIATGEVLTIEFSENTELLQALKDACEKVGYSLFLDYDRNIKLFKLTAGLTTGRTLTEDELESFKLYYDISNIFNYIDAYGGTPPSLPSDEDAWTEGPDATWTYSAKDSYGNPVTGEWIDEPYVFGSKSVGLAFTIVSPPPSPWLLGAAATGIAYGIVQTITLTKTLPTIVDLTSGNYNQFHFFFYNALDTIGAWSGEIRLKSSASDYYYAPITLQSGWMEVTYIIQTSPGTEWTSVGAPSWDNIRYIEFYLARSTGDGWGEICVDNLAFRFVGTLHVVVQDTTSQSQWGVRYKKLVLPWIVDYETLKAIAEAFLEEHKDKLSVMDGVVVDPGYTDFELGDQITVQLTDVTDTLVLTSLEHSITDDFLTNTLVLGQRLKSLEEIINGLNYGQNLTNQAVTLIGTTPYSSVIFDPSLWKIPVKSIPIHPRLTGIFDDTGCYIDFSKLAIHEGSVPWRTMKPNKRILLSDDFKGAGTKWIFKGSAKIVW